MDYTQINIIENILKMMFKNDKSAILHYIFTELKKIFGEIDGIIYKNDFIIYSSNDNIKKIDFNIIKNLASKKKMMHHNLFNNNKYYLIISLVNENNSVGILLLRSKFIFEIKNHILNSFNYLCSTIALTIESDKIKKIYKCILDTIDTPIILWEKTDNIYPNNLECLFYNSALNDILINKMELEKKLIYFFPNITQHKDISDKYIKLLKTNEDQIIEITNENINMKENYYKFKLFHVSDNIYCCVQLSLEELKHSKKKLKNNSNFMINMGHEIRTPLNGIIGMITLLSDTNLSNDQNEYLEIMKESSFKLMEIITDVLDISRLDAKNIKLEKKKLNLIKCIKESHSLAKNLKKKQVLIKYQ